jgi:hypothetical protein
MTTNAQRSSVDDELLVAILDRLIPAVDDLPSAGQMGLTSEIVRLAAQQARFNNLFENAIETFGTANPTFTSSNGDQQDDAIRTFEAASPELFGALLSIAYIVYYKDSRVHARIGWEGRTPQPDGNDMEPWDESVLETVRKRKPFWRSVD